MDVRAILALMMLVVLALSGAAPACAQPEPQPMHHAMAQHGQQPAPAHHDTKAHADCIGCGTEMPAAPHAIAIALVSPALPPQACRETMLIGKAPQLPLRPPRA